MTEEEKRVLGKIQNAAYDALCAFDEICRAHNLHYELHYGTLLGAVRHGGFIPWDDDIDLIMPRADYDRLLAILPDCVPDGFVYAPTQYAGMFLDFIPRFSSCQLTIRSIHSWYGGLLNHPGLDIFVMDAACGGVMRKIQLLMLRVCYALAMGFRRDVEMEKYTGLMKLGASVLPKIGKRLGLRRVCAWYDKVSRWGSGKSGKVFLSNAVPFYLPKSYDAAWFSERTMLTFNGREFPAPAGYDALLKCLYGDYMQLPPEDKRHPEHIAEITEETEMTR